MLHLSIPSILTVGRDRVVDPRLLDGRVNSTNRFCLVIAWARFLPMCRRGVRRVGSDFDLIWFLLLFNLLLLGFCLDYLANRWRFSSVVKFFFSFLLFCFSCCVVDPLHFLDLDVGEAFACLFILFFLFCVCVCEHRLACIISFLWRFLWCFRGPGELMKYIHDYYFKIVVHLTSRLWCACTEERCYESSIQMVI